MRHGEIVRNGSGCILRLDANCTYGKNEFKLVTVAELFDAAGHPVPGVTVGYACSVGIWKSRDAEGFGWHFNDMTWERHPTVPGKTFAPRIDLSRLPALDAWDALPEVIKAVVK